jgi:hypothetical protein
MINAAAVAVVEGRLGLAASVGIEQCADVGQRVPLRRILQMHDDDVVVDDVDHAGFCHCVR